MRRWHERAGVLGAAVVLAVLGGALVARSAAEGIAPPAAPARAGAGAARDPHDPLHDRLAGRAEVKRGPRGAVGRESGDAPPLDPDLPRRLGVAARRARPPCPAGASPVALGEDLQARIDAAPDGAALALAPGAHAGPLAITRSVTLWGPPEAIVRSRGEGSTIRVSADGAALLGFTIDGSGGRFDLLDAAVHVSAGGVRVEGLAVERALFGILVEKARGATIRGNVVRGEGGDSLGLRGDGIRLWETRGSVVCENVVTDSRDVVVWYSAGNRIERNLVARGRYGTHFMYSHDNAVLDNGYLENTVGVFVMYSRRVDVRRNVVARSRGAAGIGIGLKEAGAVTLAANRLLDDTVGIFVDTTPMDAGDHLEIEGNVLRRGDVGIAFHASPRGVRCAGNTFRDNHAAVRVDGGGSATGIEWSENDFDDYRGYDLDGDGVGDIAHEVRSLSVDLLSRHPDLAFFRGTLVLSLIDAVNHALPVFRPRVVLVDPRPRLGPREPAEPLSGGGHSGH